MLFRSEIFNCGFLSFFFFFSIIKSVVTPLEILNLRGKCNQSNHHFERHQRKPTHSHKFRPNWSIQNEPEAQSLTILFFFFSCIINKSRILLFSVRFYVSIHKTISLILPMVLILTTFPLLLFCGIKNYFFIYPYKVTKFYLCFCSRKLFFFPLVYKILM